MAELSTWEIIGLSLLGAIVVCDIGILVVCVRAMIREDAEVPKINRIQPDAARGRADGF